MARTWWIVLLPIGCTELDPVSLPDADADTDADSDADTDADIDVVDPDPPQPGTWTTQLHPCSGNRTDTMLVESDAVWVGCGTTTGGTGLYRSTDDGLSWQGIPALADWRITDVFRAADGMLYIAGTDRSGDGRGGALDRNDALTELLLNQGQLWNAMITGSVRRTPAGDIVFESLTGTDVAFRGSGDASFSNAYPWWTNGESKQILDLEIVGEDFYGCGSTIGSPPIVFLPPPNGRQGFQMAQVELRDEFDGELWDLHIDGDQIIAAGVDQDADVGVVFISGDDPFNPRDWRMFRADSHYPTQTTWFRGTCRGPSTIYAVGELSTSGLGIMLASDDEGATWYDIPLPTDTGAVHVCHVDGAGTVHVAGAYGFYGRYAP